MRKVAIVSSYGEECGAAFFSSRLKIHLEKSGLAVDVLRLPVSLLRINYPAAVRARGNREIRHIADSLAQYDAVYLQFEPGLYGASYRTAYPRVMQLLKAAKKAVLTVHGFDRETGTQSLLGSIAKGDGQMILRSALELGRNGAVSRFWLNVQRCSHVQIVTFCKADQTLLEQLYGMTRISNYPITYFDGEQANEIRGGVNRDALLTQYGLDPSKTYFGVCGFLAPYKGHLTAIKALEFLPQDWNLVIVGGEHPHALEPDKDIGSYVRQLLAFTLESEEFANHPAIRPDRRKKESQAMSEASMLQLQGQVFTNSEFKYFFPEQSLRERVKFVGQVSDAAMPQFYCGLDYVAHPYMRTRSGQSGSGPATMAVELGSRALFSNAPVFREMERYFENAMQFFNIGNFVELAEGMQRLDNFWPVLSQNRARALEKFNPAGMVDLYRTCVGI